MASKPQQQQKNGYFAPVANKFPDVSVQQIPYIVRPVVRIFMVTALCCVFILRLLANSFIALGLSFKYFYKWNQKGCRICGCVVFHDGLREERDSGKPVIDADESSKNDEKLCVRCSELPNEETIATQSWHRLRSLWVMPWQLTRFVFFNIELSFLYRAHVIAIQPDLRRTLVFTFSTTRYLFHVHFEWLRWSLQGFCSAFYLSLSYVFMLPSVSLSYVALRPVRVGTAGNVNEQHSDLFDEETEDHTDVLKQYNSRFSLYKSMPLRSLSRIWGKYHQVEIPTWLRRPALSLYIWFFNVKLTEAENQNLSSYKHLCDFFQRTLRPGVRPIDYSSPLTSPADGTVLFLGPVIDGALEQVKGVTYSITGFLGQPSGIISASKPLPYTDEQYVKSIVTSQQNVLYQCIIYLAPGDYHRFHSPADWRVKCRRHFPGQLFSVNPRIALWLQGLFNMNERAVYTGRWRHGFFSMTAVGATNVGSINVYHDQDLATNKPSTTPRDSYSELKFDKELSRGIRFRQGDMYGDFNMGSTIVLLFEAPHSFKFNFKAGDRVKVGQSLGMTNM